jgi:hypothetical protein
VTVVKKTETRVLGGLAGGPLSAADRASLVSKLGKDQTRNRARKIAGGIETQFQQQLAAMTGPEQIVVNRAVSDYTNASDAINASCRNGAPNAAALNLDAAFQIYQHYGFTTQQRVVYRLMTYKPPNACPYGAPGAPHIVAGDLIRDDAFFSTSEHRQFLINGILNPPPGTRYVKFVIIGQGGINISGGAYTNQAEQSLLEMDHPKTYMFRTAQAGQAEILFPRGRALRVESVGLVGNDIHVSATIPNPQPGAGAAVKNSFTGV